MKWLHRFSKQMILLTVALVKTMDAEISRARLDGTARHGKAEMAPAQPDFNVAQGRAVH